ncbi:WG repeat-containing protein [Hugenholtzia roseola]|uniref:WG repeat-containing protein n=1 Tax=Hugenholtzia roseola TaxID=1002 RepID=UPI00041E89B7|nr:WG repeat-containing protein [Hugenholtzia roseola]
MAIKFSVARWHFWLFPTFFKVVLFTFSMFVFSIGCSLPTFAQEFEQEEQADEKESDPKKDAQEKSNQEKSDQKKIKQDTLVLDSIFVQKYQVGLKIAEVKGKLGLLGDTNQVLIPFQYEEIKEFAKTLTAEDSTCTQRFEGMMRVRNGKLYALTSGEGKPLTALEYENIVPIGLLCQSSNPLCQVAKVKQNGFWGIVDLNPAVIDPSKKIVIRPAYDDFIAVGKVVEKSKKKEAAEQAEVEKQTYLIRPEMLIARKGQKFGLYDLSARMPLLKTEYDEIVFLQELSVKAGKKSENFVLFKVRKGAIWQYYNATKRELLPLEAEAVEPFSYHPLALVRQKNKYGFVELSGKAKIALAYDYGESFREDIAILRKGKKYGALSAENKEVIKFEYESLQFLTPESEPNKYYATLVLCKKNGKMGVLNHKGEEILPCLYDKISLNRDKFGLDAEKGGEKSFHALQ